MTVKTRLMLLIGTAIAGILVLLGLLVRDISSVYNAANFANTNTIPSIQALGDADRALADVRVWTWKLLATTDAAKSNSIAADIEAAHESLVKALNVYEKSFIDDAQDAADLAADKETLATYDTVRTHVVELARSGKKDEGLALLLDSQPAVNKVVEALATHKNYNSRLGAVNAKDAEVTRSHAMIISSGVGLLLLVVLVLTGMRTMRSLLGTLGGEPADVAAIARDVACGNLSSNVHLQPGDTTSLLATVAQMQTDLKARTGKERAAAAENDGILSAIGKSMAQIEFNLDGSVRTANTNFLNAVGYSLEEIKGRHHHTFVDPTEANGAEYRHFWDKLRSGQHDAGQYRRIGKGGREVWLQASYNPILDAAGKPFKVVEFAIDVSEQVRTTEEVRALAQAAADGDLTHRVRIEGKSGNLLALSQAINSMADGMTSIVSQIRTAVEAVRSGTDEISTGNTNLSQRTEEQASSLEQTASSMEEMTSTVKQNADNAAQANDLATAARSQAEKGGQVVAEAVNAMTGINEASNKIADIIGVIDEIAFQTNLLALNAAVEAARAGEQGRGFAVVAQEVRTLASRSAAAAKEIKELIEDSVSKVEYGSKLVSQSGQSLSDIVGAVKKASDIVAEIAAACQEQARGIDQVNKAITSLDQVTQQNAALVEEAASAAESLSEEAQHLDQMMANYQIAPGGSRPKAIGGAGTGVRTAERHSAWRPRGSGTGSLRIASAGSVGATAAPFPTY
jgi:PAS domain S-box-containing protein